MVSKDKAYIVANEQQEREVLENLGHEELVWIDDEKFPYVIFENSCVYRDKLEYLQDEEIVFDGRKEERMSDKYIVSQEFMDDLKLWKDTLDSNDDEYKHFVGIDRLTILPEVVFEWLASDEIVDEENNNRLIAIIRWVNGEDVFEVEKPKMWVVHELNTELYVTTYDGHTGITPNRDYITKFDTKEEAQSWANAHQEVLEVEV